MCNANSGGGNNSSSNNNNGAIIIIRNREEDNIARERGKVLESTSQIVNAVNYSAHIFT